MTSTCRGAPLGVEPGHGRSRGNAVQRHVDDRCDAARGRGPRAVLEPLPIVATGIVEVHVRVDESRTDDERTGVDLRRVVGTSVITDRAFAA